MHVHGIFQLNFHVVINVIAWTVVLSPGARGSVEDDKCGSVENCSPKTTLLCKVRDSEFCREHADEFTRLPGHLSWPGRPRELVVQPMTARCDGEAVSGLTLQWKPPLDGSLKQLKGFRLVVLPLDGPLRGQPAICRLFDLRNASWTLFDVDMMFNFDLVPLPDDTQFSVTLSSLPLPEVRHQSSLDHHMTVYIPSRASWHCRLEWSVQVRNITVVFDLAPKSQKIFDYLVMLVEKKNSTVITRYLHADDVDKSTSKLKTIFTELPFGVYEIQVMPLGGMCRGDCVVTVSKLIRIEEILELNMSYTSQDMAPVPSSEPTSDPSVDMLTVLSSIMGGVMVLGMIGVVCLMRRRQVCNKIREQIVESRSPFQEVEVPLANNNDIQKCPPRKSILFINFEESVPNNSIVNNFAKYLYFHCFCDVFHLDSITGDHPDTESNLKSTLDWVDCITAIHTEDSLHQTYKINTDCAAKLALDTIRSTDHLLMKCAHVCFHPFKHDIFNNGSKSCYVLMSDFNEYLYFVHKSIFTTVDNYSLTDEGRDLLNSIKMGNLCVDMCFVEPSDVSDVEDDSDDTSVCRKLRNINAMSSMFS